MMVGMELDPFGVFLIIAGALCSIGILLSLRLFGVTDQGNPWRLIAAGISALLITCIAHLTLLATESVRSWNISFILFGTCVTLILFYRGVQSLERLGVG